MPLCDEKNRGIVSLRSAFDWKNFRAARLARAGGGFAGGRRAGRETLARAYRAEIHEAAGEFRDSKRGAHAARAGVGEWRRRDGLFHARTMGRVENRVAGIF